MEIELKLVAIGLLFVFIFISGFWLYRTGKPINTVILTLHKLISLAAAVLIAISLRQLGKRATMSAPEIILIVVTGLLFLLAILSGGWLSTGKPAPVVIIAVHRVTPFLCVLSTVTTFYLVFQAP